MIGYYFLFSLKQFCSDHVYFCNTMILKVITMIFKVITMIFEVIPRKIALLIPCDIVDPYDCWQYNVICTVWGMLLFAAVYVVLVATPIILNYLMQIGRILVTLSLIVDFLAAQ